MQFNPPVVARQAEKIRAIPPGESIQPLQRSGRLESFRVQLHRRMGGIATRAAAGCFLGVARMGRAVSTEKKAGIAADGGIQQGLAMRLPLEDRQAVIMRPHPTGQQRIAVVKQMMGGDGRGDRRARCADEIHALTGRDMLQDDAQARKAPGDRLQMRLDEAGFPIENVHLRVGHFPVNLQRHVVTFHGFQHGINPFQGRNPRLGIRGRTRGIQLEAQDFRCFRHAAHFIGRGGFREIQAHVRLKRAIRRHRVQNAGAVAKRLRHRGHRRPEIGHDQGTGELAGAVRNHRRQHAAITNVQVPVIRRGEDDAIHRNFPEAGSLISRSIVPISVMQFHSRSTPTGTESMPIYEYACQKCRHELEALQKISDPPLQDCPECGQPQLQKKISAAGFRLKGGGWYETDFKASGDRKKNLVGDSGGVSDAGESKPAATDAKTAPSAAASSED
jgi:putative FmdB family regulatory protein